ncbi:hypothetical protein [Roseospirillum parvum]|uniref:Uncharacterized protein n=1 Tax=Roseospirillum parvum TaxID=83401 RepID=A0A1G8FTS3_9PROT|nr:hypothetical protein [Roseospirillum parvum]SDH85521.1 hypothetical protein SAMN05421742_11618 [Roseospirillum parvum]
MFDDRAFVNPRFLDTTPVEWAQIEAGMRRARRERSKAQADLLKTTFRTLVQRPLNRLAEAFHHHPGTPAHG